MQIPVGTGKGPFKLPITLLLVKERKRRRKERGVGKIKDLITVAGCPGCVSYCV